MRISDWSSDVCSSDLVRLANDVRPPAVEGVQHRRQPHEENPFSPRIIVHPADAAGSQSERAERSDQRPGAGRKNMIIVVLGTSNRLIPLSLLPGRALLAGRSEENTSELQSLMRLSYAVFCLKKKKQSKTM